MSEAVTFESVVSDTFDSIMLRYGYDLVASDDSYVRIDSHVSSIQLHYDRRRSFEVGLEFSELANGESLRRTPFNLGEVFRECSVPDADSASFFQSADILQVRRFLASVAETLVTYCEPVLRGDHGFFEAVGHRRSDEAAAHTRQIQLQSVRDEADLAWRDKEYQAFVHLLVKFRDVLSEADQRKLEYAEKNLISN